MNKDTRAIVALTEKWLEEIKKITVGYERAIGVLAKAEADYNSQTKRWWIVLFNWLLPLISIIVVLLVLSFVLHSTCPNPLDIKFQGLEISQHCKLTR